MSDHTTIEWTDATWNPITGCSVVSAGCKHCYAMKLAGTRLRHHESRAGLTVETAAGPVWNGQVRFNAQWLQQPLQWSRPRDIFVCAHGDLFHPNVPDDWIDQVFAVMALAQRHTFQVLTKRPGRALDYLRHGAREALIGREVSRLHLARTGSPVSEWPGLPLPNVWLGVSAEDQKSWDERVELLRQINAEVRYVSVEPLLGDLGRISLQGIRWVIVGGESGANARPMHPDWVRGLRDQCTDQGVAFFFKQWGEWMPTSSGDWCRSPTAPEHELFREKYGRGGYEFPGKEGRAILRDGRVCRVDPAGGSMWMRPDSVIGDPVAAEAFREFVRNGHRDPGYQWMYAVGKKVSGRLLDGRAWNETPVRYDGPRAGGSHAA